MTALATPTSLIEEIILSGIPEGHLAYNNPTHFAEIASRFVEEKTVDRSLPEIAEDPIAHNHLAYLMADESERFDDDLIEQYAELAEHIFRTLAFQKP